MDNIIFIDIQIFYVQKNLTHNLIFFIWFPFPSPFWWIRKAHFNHSGRHIDLNTLQNYVQLNWHFLLQRS